MTSRTRMAWAEVLSSSHKNKGNKHCMECFGMGAIKAGIGLGLGCPDWFDKAVFTGRLSLGICGRGMDVFWLWAAWAAVIVFGFETFGYEVAVGGNAPIEAQWLSLRCATLKVVVGRG